MDSDDGLEIPNLHPELGDYEDDYEDDYDEDDYDDEDYEEEGEEEEDVADLPDEGEEEEEFAEPPASDSAFAQMRRDKEALERENAELLEALGLFFDGDNKVEQAHAYYNDEDVDDVIERFNAEREQRALNEESERLRADNEQLAFDNKRMRDLQEIKAEYPDAEIDDVLELGEKFFAFRTNGMSATLAYETIMAGIAQPPKSMGKLKTGRPTRGYYTRDEVEAMSSSERIKNYDKIRKSMGHWK